LRRREEQALHSPAHASRPRLPIGLRRGPYFLREPLAQLPNSTQDLPLDSRQTCEPEPLADRRQLQYLALLEFHEQVQPIEFQSAQLSRQGIPTCLRQIFRRVDGTPKRQASRLHLRVSLHLQPRERPASCNAY